MELQSLIEHHSVIDKESGNSVFLPNWYILKEFTDFLLGSQFQIDSKRGIILKDGTLYNCIMHYSEQTKWKINEVLLRSPLTPEECYLQSTTYAVTIIIRVRDKENDEAREKRVHLMTLPIMVGSLPMFHPPLPNYQCCNFIANGLNTALIHIERHAVNIPLVHFRDKMAECYVKNKSSIFFSVMYQEKSGFSVKVKMITFTWDEYLLVVDADWEDIKQLSDLFQLPLPSFIIHGESSTERTKILKEKLRGYAWKDLINEEQENDEQREIEEDGNTNREVNDDDDDDDASGEEDNAPKTKRRRNTLHNDGRENDRFKELFLPFLSDEANDRQKLYFLFQCAKKCKDLSEGKEQESDLDNIKFKRYLTATQHVHGLVDRLLKRFFETVDFQDASFAKKRDQLSVSIQKPFVDASQEFIPKTASPIRLMKEGISELNAMSIFRSYLLKIHPENMDMSIRIWNGSSHGFIDPIATPEGKQVGLVNHFAFLTEVSTELPMKRIISEHFTSFIDFDAAWREDQDQSHLLFANSILIGKYKEGTFQHAKKIKHEYYPTLSVSMFKGNIYLHGEEGRLLRPLRVLHHQQQQNTREKSLSWDSLLFHGIVEWIDVREQESIIVCQTYDTPQEFHTHQVLHDCDTISIQAACLPFIHHDKAARNLIASVMMGQAIGYHYPQCRYNLEPRYHLLSAQPKVNETSVARLVRINKTPVSTNVVVAVAALDSNVDDSIVVNKSFIDKGGFHILANTWYRYVLPKGHRFAKPDKRPHTIPPDEWKKLGSDGIIHCTAGIHPVLTLKTPLAVTVNEKGDISKIHTLHFTANIKGIPELDYIYRVTETKSLSDTKGNPVLLVNVTHLRPALCGDKLTSLSGQKGVIGQIIPSHDLFFAMNTGIIPDIVVNPHGIFSRCTVGQLIDMLAGVGVLMSPNIHANSSPFDFTTNLRHIETELKKIGMTAGYERCINGKTGEMITNPLFIGVIPYAKLVHFAADKSTSTCNPPIDIETRAPVKGRKNGGGVRFGEMEFGGAGSHGAAAFLGEKTNELCDGTPMVICERCGRMNAVNLEEVNCAKCGGLMYHEKVPYSTWTLKRRLICGNMDFTLKTSDKQ